MYWNFFLFILKNKKSEKKLKKTMIIKKTKKRKETISLIHRIPNSYIEIFIHDAFFQVYSQQM